MNIEQVIQGKTMKTIAGVFFLTLLLGAPEARAQCDGTRRVSFERGLTTAVIKGAIPASKAICYELRARAGQKMIVRLSAPARGVLLTVFPEGYDVEPLAQDVADWEGVLEETGDYTGGFSGVYQTDYGPLRLTRTGEQVRGTYTRGSEKDSTVTGTVRGNVLTGRWTEPSGKGTFRFTLAPDGRSFKGRFGLGGDSQDAGEWDGHCGDDGHR